MPIFEFHCSKCDKTFDMLVKGSLDTQAGQKPKCPSCGSTDMEKQFSVFAAHTSGKQEVPCCSSACDGGFSRGTCGSGGCGHNH